MESESTYTAPLLGSHIQQISFSEHLQLLHRSTWIEGIEQLLPWRTQSSSAGARGAAAHWEQIQQLHWSIMSSCFPGAQRAAMLEAGACVTVALWQQIHFIHWRTWISTSMVADSV